MYWYALSVMFQGSSEISGIDHFLAVTIHRLALVIQNS